MRKEFDSEPVYDIKLLKNKIEVTGFYDKEIPERL